MLLNLLIAAACALATPPDGAGGIIEGIVVNGSQRQAPVPRIEVVLRVSHEGPFAAIAQTTTGADGRFRFENLPVEEKGLVFLPGANHLGIHYPGGRIRFSGRPSSTFQRIAVYDTLSEKNPLVATRHEIELRADTGVLTVNERIVIVNRSLHSYIGSTDDDAQSPVTLRLSIPPEFDKVTFDKEFFGREFHLTGRLLETSIPWTPGKQELKFTYRLPLSSSFARFHRPLDLPTEGLRVTVVRGPSGEVACNLPAAAESNDKLAVFEANGKSLDAGEAIEVALGSLPVPWTHYSRWVALAVLLLLVIGTAVFAF